MGLRFGRSIEISHLMLSEGSQDWIWMELDIPSHAIGRVSGWNGKELDITSHVIGRVSGLEWEGLGYHISCYRKALRFGKGRSWISHFMLEEGSQVWY